MKKILFYGQYAAVNFFTGSTRLSKKEEPTVSFLAELLGGRKPVGGKKGKK